MKVIYGGPMDQGFKLSYIAGKEQSLSVRVYNIGHERCKSNHKWGPGVRDFYLMHHVLSGKGYYIVGGKRYELTAGSTFLIYPNTNVTYFADTYDPWEYYWVGFQGNDAGLLLDMTVFTPDHPVTFRNPGSELKEMLAKIYEAKGKEEACKVRMAGYLMLALAYFIREVYPEDRDLANLYCRKAAEYIAYNYSQQITVEEIADYIGISRSQLYRVFMLMYNKSPKQYLTEYRIEQALRLLKDPKLTINAVARSVGFEDNLYFSRVFRKFYGVSPGTYRREMGNQK